MLSGYGYWLCTIPCFQWPPCLWYVTIHDDLQLSRLLYCNLKVKKNNIVTRRFVGNLKLHAPLTTCMFFHYLYKLTVNYFTVSFSVLAFLNLLQQQLVIGGVVLYDREYCFVNCRLAVWMGESGWSTVWSLLYRVYHSHFFVSNSVNYFII